MKWIKHKNSFVNLEKITEISFHVHNAKIGQNKINRYIQIDFHVSERSDSTWGEIRIPIKARSEREANNEREKIMDMVHIHLCTENKILTL